MSALFLLVSLLVQDPAPAPAPWTGSLAAGLAEMRRLSEAQKPEEALAIADRMLSPGAFARWRESATARPGWKRDLVESADPLLAAVGLSALASAERASVHFARGVVLATAEKRAEASDAFEQSRALAGQGDLRLDSTYDLGWTALAEGEALRAKIPELGGTPPAPAAAGQAPQAPPEPDPLQLALAAYRKAREHFLERLKADAGDGDTRANAELVQRRLRELSEIQKKREEEKKKQEQEKQDQEKKDPQKKDQGQKDQDKKDQDAKDPQKPDEKPKPDEKKPDEEKKPPEDSKSDADKQEKKEGQPPPAQEGPLTKEEVQRLLDTLKEREEEGKKLLEQLRRARRAKVKKDW